MNAYIRTEKNFLLEAKTNEVHTLQDSRSLNDKIKCINIFCSISEVNWSNLRTEGEMQMKSGAQKKLIMEYLQGTSQL